MFNHPRLAKLEDYVQYVGDESVERILKKAKPLRDLHVVNVNSTYYGGGVAELLGSMTILMNSIGIKTGWRVIQGSPDFFSITKKMHNALQGGEINLTDRKKPGRSGIAEVPAGGLWPHRVGGYVEGGRGDWGQCGRHPLSD